MVFPRTRASALTSVPASLAYGTADASAGGDDRLHASAQSGQRRLERWFGAGVRDELAGSVAVAPVQQRREHFRVARRLSVGMVVEEHVGVARLRFDFRDSIDPRHQFLRGITVVVARDVTAVPPRLGIATVESHVSDAGGGVRGRIEQPFQSRHVDVPVARAERAQELDGFGTLPRPVSKLDDYRKVRERLDHRANVGFPDRVRLEPVRKLSEHAGELAGRRHRLQARTKGARVVVYVRERYRFRHVGDRLRHLKAESEVRRRACRHGLDASAAREPRNSSSRSRRSEILRHSTTAFPPV